MKDITELDVFKLAHFLVLRVYKLTETFPKEEMYGLTSQIGRASISIPANLAEGANRVGRKEFKYFISIAKGSSGEIQYLIQVSKDLNYLKEEDYRELKDGYKRVAQMLTKLKNAI
jgi:four helix bundle protein